jgi:chloramphenicol 3-O-phosphotransferase
VVILNGPPGVGKTTVGRLLAGRAAAGACVHGDALREFPVTRTPHVERGLGYVNGATVAANLLRGGYELVVFDYCFEHPRHVSRFLAAYAGAAPVHLVTLWAPLGVVRARERDRPGRRRLGRRVEEAYAAMAAELAGLGTAVDATDPPTMLAARIDALTAAGGALVREPAPVALPAP